VLSSGWADAAGVVVVELSRTRREELAAGLGRRFPALTVTDEIPDCAGAVLAVKPGDVEAACRSLAGSGVSRVLSIAAGVRLDRLEGWLGVPSAPPQPAGDGPPRLGREGDPPPSRPPGPAVVRAMPNTPALFGAGAAALSPGSAAGPGDMAWASGLLASVGTVTEVPERLLDPVTGLSGSGPAYVFLLAEALIDAGVLVGLARSTARELAVQTLLGSARLLAESGEGPESLRAGVTSPGGTTAAGLRALEAAGFRAAVMDAVVAATERSRQLGT
jgi:pyrroline-5-carboxylate reductase